MTKNFGDFQWSVYGDAVRGISSRYPFDFESIERKAIDALPDWVYRYVSAAAGDGRTQRANIDAYSRYGIIPRMMVSPPERDLSIDLFGKHLPSPMFMSPIGLIGLCSPDFQGDVASAQASANTGVPFTLSTFSQTPMDEVIKHAGSTPSFFQLYLPGDRELAASFLDRAESSGYSSVVVTVDSWTLGYRPADLAIGNYPQARGFCMENYYSDENFTKHLAKPPHEDPAATLRYYASIFAVPLAWEDLRWIRDPTPNFPSRSRGFSTPTMPGWRSTMVPTYCTDQSRWSPGEFGTPDSPAVARGCRRGGLHSGDVRWRHTQRHRCRHRFGIGSNGGRPRPVLRVRPLLWRRRELDPLPEIFPRRAGSVFSDLRIQGHREP